MTTAHWSARPSACQSSKARVGSSTSCVPVRAGAEESGGLGQLDRVVVVGRGRPAGRRRHECRGSTSDRRGAAGAAGGRSARSARPSGVRTRRPTRRRPCRRARARCLGRQRRRLGLGDRAGGDVLEQRRHRATGRSAVSGAASPHTRPRSTSRRQRGLQRLRCRGGRRRGRVRRTGDDISTVRVATHSSSAFRPSSASATECRVVARERQVAHRRRRRERKVGAVRAAVRRADRRRTRAASG